MQITVCTADVTPLYDPPLFDRYYGQLPQWRRETVDFYRFTKDKALCLGASVLLDQALRRCGTDLNSVRFARTPGGKPYLSSHPQLHISLAHAGTKAMAAVSPCPIGVDVESIIENDDIDICTWTLAESYIKLTDATLDDYLQGRLHLPPPKFYRRWRSDGYWWCVCTADPLPADILVKNLRL